MTLSQRSTTLASQLTMTVMRLMSMWLLCSVAVVVSCIMSQKRMWCLWLHSQSFERASFLVLACAWAERR